MTAPQNVWAHPLGQTLVDSFRETNVWLIQQATTTPSYDPITGTVQKLPSRIWHCGGAILKKSQGPHATFSTQGFALKGTQMELWLDGITMPIEPTTLDSIWYQNTNWAITNIDPMLESDDSFYAYKLICDLSGDQRAPAMPGSAPPISAYPAAKWARVESISFRAGPPVDLKLKWSVEPGAVGPAVVGALLTGTAGTVTGGVAPFAYTEQWELGPDASVGPWAAIPGATGLTFTPRPGDAGQYLRLTTTATDSETPAAASTTHSSVPLLISAPALVRATLPMINGRPLFEVGQKITGTAGTATGGTAPIAYTSHWELSADGSTGWVTTPGEALKPDELTLTAAMAGQHVRYVTVATDATAPTAQALEIDSAVSPSIAVHTTTAISAVSAPVISGAPADGASLSVATDAVAGDGVPPFTYAYRWQHAPAALGPWTDVPGATGKNYTVASSLIGEYLRVVAAVTDSETTPGPNKLDIPSASVGPVAATLAADAAPVLPAGGPQANTTWGPATAGTFQDGAPPYTVTNRWQLSPDGTTGWTDIASATGLSYTPAPGDAGQYLRLVSSASDTAGNTAESASVASAVVSAATIYCACGPVKIGVGSYCIATPAGGTWSYESSHYDFVLGLASGWLLSAPGNPADGTFLADAAVGVQDQVDSPGTRLVYSAPQGVAGDWVQRAGDPAGTWHNLRTGVWIERAPLARNADGSAGAPSNPGTCGYVIAPSPAVAITTVHTPTPATGTWVQSGGGPGVPPTWTQNGTGAAVQQWGDPTVIGLAGATTLVWLGTGTDPWVSDRPNHWVNAATGQSWPSGSTAPTPGTRPQPPDTATIPRPAVSVPKFDGTAVAGFDPWVQLPRASPIGWWNYITRQELQQTTHPPIEVWVESSPGSNQWYRQTDGLQLTQRRRPDLPADTAADWWEAPAGTWHSLLRSEIYVQAANPGTAGNVVAVQAATPKGAPAQWTRSGSGTPVDPYVWSSTALGSKVTQPGNPGIAGVIGTEVLTLAQQTAPAVTGSVKVGVALAGSDGAVSGGTGPFAQAYQWQRQQGSAAWVAITGATSKGYTPVAGDVGYKLRLQVRWTDSATPAQAVTLTSAATAAVAAAGVPLGAGTIPAPTSALHVGDPVNYQVGTSTGGTAPVTHSAQLQASPDGTTGWTAVGAPIATGSGTYTLLAGDAGKYFRVVDTVTDSATPTQATVTDTSTSIGPVVSGFSIRTQPTITGKAEVGQGLTATPSTVQGGTPPYDPGDYFAGITPGPAYQWQSAPESAPGSGTPGAWLNIAGATNALHTVTAVDGNHYLRVVISHADSATPTAHTVQAFSAPTALVAAPPAWTMIQGLRFGDPDVWTLGFKANPAYSGNLGVEVWWVNSRTGQRLRQPLDPRTPVPAKVYSFTLGGPAYPTFSYKTTPDRGPVIYGMDRPTGVRTDHVIQPSEMLDGKPVPATAAGGLSVYTGGSFGPNAVIVQRFLPAGVIS